MKNPFFLFLLVTALDIKSQELYNQNVVYKMDLEFYDPDYKSLLEANYLSETDIPARLTFNDEIILDSVGVRYKGNSSYHTQGDKKSFNVSIDTYREDQRLLGYKTLNLNNAFLDPTFMRERLGNTIFENYLPAPKTSHIYLYINGAEYGLYNNVQQINKDFLGEWYSSKKGNCYKGDPQGELSWLGNNPELYKTKYEKKTNEEEDDWSDLINLINVINNSSDLEDELPKYLNTDRALWYFALCNAFVNLDSYIFSSHNYYLYNNPATGKFDFLPWDVNEIFGTFPPNLPFDKDKFQPVDLNAPNRTPLLKKMLSNNKFKSIYYSHYRTIVKEFMDKTKIEPLINEIRPIIEPYVQQDPNKLYSYDNFKTNITSDVTFENRKVFGILSFIEKRRSFLSQIAQLDNNYPIIQNVVSVSEKLIAGNKAYFNTTVTGDNISRVIFHYRNGESSFVEIPMYDDGNHQDNVANDNVFGAFIDIPADIIYNNFDYYVTAENQAGRITFMPEKAEFVFLSKQIEIPVDSKSIVLNEFMADNENIITDPQGDNEDWIELYNKSGTPVSLKSWYLTDDPASPQKWQFPDLEIPAKGYLLIWADEDGEDEGLHCNFKLSKSGEYIGLFDNNSILIDSYSFSEQAENISEGRYPNGTGSFIFLNKPTPGAENTDNSSATQEESRLIGIFPNPADDFIEIVLDAKSSDPLKLRSDVMIFNPYGECLRDLVKYNKDSGNTIMRIDISHLPSGLYFVKSGKEIIKFVKM